MTRKLESLFDLPPSIPAEDEPTPQPAEDLRSQLQTLDDNIDKIDSALPGVRGLEANDEEMDGLADLAKSSYNDLMDLGMQVDSRFASEIFSVASNMLGHAITAKTMQTAQGMVLSRNDLLERLLASKDQKDKKE